ncbi:MAG: glycogen/starch/alpha-glucan phosphorylase [Gemmatimonadetes bacterium]|nr:MAG: glycogen/starch/alpha-glucan phosphorylase [Gemmatimonadota bacterium]
MKNASKSAYPQPKRHQMDVASLKQSFINRLTFSIAKDEYSATALDRYQSVALAVRDLLVERWIKTQQAYYDQDVKRVYYLSLEFLIGRLLGNNLINLGIFKQVEQALQELGYRLEDIRQMENDAGLGNGGLGRLAACFLDSMATLELPAYGYTIRYEYGIFNQHIENGYQTESPDNWLRYGNVWEFPRPEYLYPVQFYGRVHQYSDAHGRIHNQWVDTENVMAMAYDVPIAGYGCNTVNTMRLWAAKSTREFDFSDFNAGDYVGAVEHKNETENITRVLYPNDTVLRGKELRLKQEYFFVSATLQDIIRRYRKKYDTFDKFPEKISVQLNDTHPALAIPELMRRLVDGEAVPWDKAWDITTRTFGYTNHTVLPEALERWRVPLIERMLPRHLQIIYEINQRFLDRINVRYPGDVDRLREMSIIEEGDEKRVRMANLCIIGSHSVNGVAELHTQIIKNEVFPYFHEFFPAKFNNKTNGITHRRWLLLANPRLSALITDTIGDGWIRDLNKLKELIPYADDVEFQQAWRQVKYQNKVDLAKHIQLKCAVQVDPASMFDIQIKRMHEYKRQLLNVLHVITLYHRLKANPQAPFQPRTVIFGGKAAPGYYMAKLIIKLINSVAEVVNRDPDTLGKLRVAFVPNYNVSQAQILFPGADLSEQISTAGMEASGTGNMKFMLNGAVTIGTLDGANVEILEEVGEDNMFIFGLKANEVRELRNNGYNPWEYYQSNPELKRVIDSIADGMFCTQQRDLFHPIVNSLLHDGDYYCLLADYAAYVACQAEVEKAYQDEPRWTRMSILNVANSGKFTTDRTIRQYAAEIWGIKPCPIQFD